MNKHVIQVAKGGRIQEQETGIETLGYKVPVGRGENTSKRETEAQHDP